MKTDVFGARSTLETAEGPAVIYRLSALEKAGACPALGKLPFSIRVLLEAVLRNLDGELVDRAGRQEPRRLERRRPRRTSSCPSCPRASSFRTSRACPRWWTSPRCGRR